MRNSRQNFVATQRPHEVGSKKPVDPDPSSYNPQNPFLGQSPGKRTPVSVMTPMNQSNFLKGNQEDSKDFDQELYSESEVQDDLSDEDHVKDLQFDFEGKKNMCKVVYHSDKYLKIGDPKRIIAGNKFDGGEEDVYTGMLNPRQQRHGFGVMFYGNGDIYRGDWVNDNKSGKGQYLFGNGNHVEGTFKENSLNGVTIVRFADGVELCAYFTNNQIASEEIEVNFDKQQQPVFKYEGKEPEEDGQGGWKAEGALLFKNDDVFKGTIFNGKIEGQGRLDYANGDCRI